MATLQALCALLTLPWPHVVFFGCRVLTLSHLTVEAWRLMGRALASSALGTKVPPDYDHMPQTPSIFRAQRGCGLATASSAPVCPFPHHTGHCDGWRVVLSLPAGFAFQLHTQRIVDFPGSKLCLLLRREHWGGVVWIGVCPSWRPGLGLRGGEAQVGQASVPSPPWGPASPAGTVRLVTGETGSQRSASQNRV